MSKSSKIVHNIQKRKKPGTGTTVETDEPDSRHRDCFSKMCA